MSIILVTGATGNVGRQVVLELLASGTTVRALAHSRGRDSLPDGVDVADGDLAAPDTLQPALRGVDTVFLVWPFLTTVQAPAVLEAIGRHARRLVYLSSAGVNDGAERQTDPINQLHADMESLIATSGLTSTILRSDTIASNALGWADQIRSGDVVRGPEIAATAVIHERDVAAVAARALTQNGRPEATHVLTGPDVVSRADQVRAIGDALGRPLRFEKVPTDLARRQMLADGRPPALVEALLASADGRTESRVVTSTFEDLMGRPPRTFRQWAIDHADDFR